MLVVVFLFMFVHSNNSCHHDDDYAYDSMTVMVIVCYCRGSTRRNLMKALTRWLGAASISDFLSSDDCWESSPGPPN